MKKIYLKKMLYTYIALHLLSGGWFNTCLAANDFIISGDDETQTTIAGNKAYGQDYFVKKDENGNFVQDAQWQHEGAIIMAKGLGDSNYRYVFNKVKEGWILPTYLNLNAMPDNWAPTLISMKGASYHPGKEGYNEVAQPLREAINAMPGDTVAEKLAAFVKSGNVPDNLKKQGMVMLYFELGDDTDACYSKLREGQTAIEPNYGTVQIGRLGVWRPMDWGDTVSYQDESCMEDANLSKLASFRIMPNGQIRMFFNFKDKQKPQLNRVQQVDEALLYVDKIEMQPSAKIDLSYANTVGNNPRVNQYSDDKVYYPNEYVSEKNNTDSKLARTMVVNEAVLDKNTTFRIGCYKNILSNGHDNKGEDSGQRLSDTIWLKNATKKIADDNTNKIYIELGYVPELGEKIEGTVKRSEFSGQYNPIFGIMHGADDFEVEGRATRAEGLFSEYLITPEIASNQSMKDFFTDEDGNKLGRGWELAGYTYQIVGASEGGKTAVDNMIVANNLWKNSLQNIFKHPGGIYKAGEQPSTKEHIWADGYHENFDSASEYGRKLHQNINGYQFGYDHLLIDKFYNGKLYGGVFINHNTGSSTTLTGNGKQTATGIGLYGTWRGNRGHYIDVAFVRSTLDNDYQLQQNFTDQSERIKASFDTVAYGLGAQYGYRKEFKKSWYIEPQLSVFASKVNGCSYDLQGQSRSQSVEQDDFSNISALAGLYLGRDLADKGDIHVGLFAGHNYSKDMSVGALYKSEITNNIGQVVSTTVKDTVDTPDSEDGWYELNVGGKYNLSKNTSLYVDYRKTLGSNIGNSWKVKGGLQGTF